MRRPGAALAVLGLLALALGEAGCSTRTCRARTAFVTLELPPSLPDIDTFDVTIDYAQTRRAVSDLTRDPSATPTLAVDLGAAYRTDEWLTVTVEAKRGGVIVGLGEASFRLKSGCTPYSLPVAAKGGADLGGALPRDGAELEDAGPGDGGGGDLANPSRCDGFGGIACYDGEHAVVAPWATTAPQGSADVSSEHVYRGTSALKLSVSPGASDTSAKAQLSYNGLPQAQRLYVRAFLFTEAAPPAFTPLLGLQQATMPYAGVMVAVDVGGTFKTIGNKGPELSDVVRTSTRSLTPGRWVCLELGIDFMAGTASVWIDDVHDPSLDLGELSIVPPPPVSAFYGGINQAAVSGVKPAAWALWVDEVGIDTMPIGCVR